MATWLRLAVSLKVIGAWGGALLLWVLLACVSSEQSAWGIWWWIKILSLFSLPIGVVAVVAAFIFARSISAKPVLWAKWAVAISLLLGIAIAQGAGIFALVVSLPAAVIFVLLDRWVPKYFQKS